ncbi:MAG: aldehyde dehydrogenase family protein [Rhodospirillaceae bacterium]|nr:MAG: aldehyde dehydrogenase family protein [Rhodospirillaceae bacterium]
MLVKQPFDGAPITEIVTDDAAAVEAKLERAMRCFRDRASWLPVHKRIEILRRLARLMERDQEQLAMTIAREGGKPLTDARIEAARAINGAESAAGELEHHAGREIPMGLTPASANRLAFTTKEPIGVVAAISAFNHPLNLVVHQVVPAIATGCPVIIKPAGTTPLSCKHFVALVHEAGLPPDWCQLAVIEDNAIAERLATDPRVAFFSFIGSAKVGWYLRSKLAPGTRCALEHGGAAPVIVDRSADIASIIEPLAKGGYYHAGQVCVSVQRIFVHEALKADFAEAFTARVAKLRVGDPTAAETEVGPLILPREVDRVESWVKEAAGSSKVLLGGNRISDHVYAPTVLLEPPAKAKVSSLEVFGPVTCIYGYSDLDDAIARANSLDTAFQSAIFARDIDVALKAARLLDASAVMINDHTAFRVDWMPFAGRRQSGYGIGGIPYTMHDMSQEKMITLKT